jgi:hypothetical protein
MHDEKMTSKVPFCKVLADSTLVFDCSGATDHLNVRKMNKLQKNEEQIEKTHRQGQ